MNLFDWTKEHPLSVLMACTAFILFGGISFFELAFEELPDLQIPEIRIAAAFPGFPPEEMEQLVTIPMENALSTVRDVSSMDSVSKAGISSVTLRFDWGADLDQASLEVRESIDTLYPLLPQGVKKPVVYTSDLSHRPCVTLALIPPPGRGIEELYSLVQYGIKGEFQKLEEVSLVELRGLRKPEVHVDLDMDSLETLNLTVDECSQALSGYLVNRSIGKVEDAGLRRLVKMETGITSPAEIGALSPFPGRNLKLSDIATVQMERREPTSLFLYEGRDGVGIHLFKSASSGTLEAVGSILKILPELQRAYQGRLEIVLIEESGSRIKDSFRSLLSALLWGLAAASAILFLLYRELLIPLITALSIPVTLVLVFFFLYLLKISLNTLSLMGMVVGIGLIADSSIVVLEEISRPGGNLKTVSPALLASALTTIIVFLPPLFIPGITSVLFHDLIVTILLTIALSLPVSHFFTPACFILLGGEDGSKRRSPKRNKPYRKILYISLKHKNRVLTLFFLILGGTILLCLSIPVEILPAQKTGKGVLSLTLPRRKDFKDVRRTAQQVIGDLKKEMKTERIYLESGFDEDNLKARSEARRSLHDLNIHIQFIPGEDEEKLMKIMDQRAFFEPEESLFESLLRGTILENIELLSQDREKLYGFLLPEGYQDQMNQDLPILQFESDRDSLNASGLTGVALLRTLSSEIRGTVAGEILLSGEREKIPVILRASQEYRGSKEDLLQLGFKQENGLIRLGQLGSLSQRIDSAELYRSDRQNMRPIKAFREGKGMTGIEILAKTLPQEIRMKETRGTEGHQLVVLFLFALVLMYLVLGIQSGSPWKALLLFSSIPLSLPGSFLLLKIFTQSLNLYSFIGLLILQGTIVNTAILLVSSYKNNSLTQVLTSSAQRLRPVAATTLTTIAALVPVFITAWKREDPNASMTLAVMGGMLLGTILIMIFIPTLFVRSSQRHD